MDITENNRHVWAQESFSDWSGTYTGEMEFFNPILEELGDISPFHMLDIGVGGGRSTTLFGDKVRRYTGTDYAKHFVEGCRARWPHLEFRIRDVTRGIECGDDEYDLVLFPYNGIDYCDSKDREFVISEMARVCKKGGFVCFSTHNLRSLTTEDPWNKGILYIDLSHPLKKIPQYMNRGFFGHEMEKKLVTCYEKPETTIKSMRVGGLSDILVFSKSGILDEEEIKRDTSPYLYFLGIKE